MASGDEKFTCGRHKDKTFAYVEEMDKAFCQLALTTASSKFVPEEFKNYLKSRLQTAPIQEYSARHFVDALKNSPEKLGEFIEIVGTPPIETETKHEQMNFKSNGFKGVFFRFAFLKYIFNKNNVNAHTRVLNPIVKVFPIKIESVHSLADEIVSRLDDSDTFLEEVRDFVRVHFHDFTVSERLHDVIDNFLSNIVNFYQNHFDGDAETKAFRRWVKSGFKRSSSFDTQKHDDALKHIPRLNDRGAERYTVFYEVYNKVAALYGQNTLPIPTYKEFHHLIEKNIDELCSLIDETFFVANPAEYTNRFKKYLFFFIYTTIVDDDESSVFIIDDCLFECAKALSTYRQVGTDPTKTKFETSLCALIHRRKQSHDDELRKYSHKEHEQGWFDIHDLDLAEMKRVAESYPKIETAIMHETVQSEQLYNTVVYLRTNDTIIDFYLSFRPKDEITNFFYLIVSAALYKDTEFRKLVNYNALLGQVTSIEMTYEKQLKIYEFIEKHNVTPDYEVKFPPGKRLTWGFEDCFVGGTRQRYREPHEYVPKKEKNHSK